MWRRDGLRGGQVSQLVRIADGVDGDDATVGPWSYDVLRLTTSYRSRPEIQRFVNTAFSATMRRTGWLWQGVGNYDDLRT